MPSLYDPETITLATLEEIPEELQPLQKALKQFLKVNSPNWSASSLANFLGMDVHTLKAFAGKEFRNFNSEKAHTILVLRPIEHAEIDAMKVKACLL